MMKMFTSNKGVFISFEGIDGCGKSTQVSLLLSRLNDQGIKTKLVREPGGTKISEKIRNILLNKNYYEMSSRTEALLMTASRAQLTKEEIIPALEKGIFVIADRFKDSTLAYQGGGRGLNTEFLIGLNDFATFEIDPDLTFFLDIDAKDSFSLSKIENADRIEGAGIEFQQKVRNEYNKLAKLYDDRFITIDGSKSISVIHSTIWEKTINFFNENLK
tara:strand:- start:4371 stop:5021 length:651 start_codon:yes stop_codon:yes gene_type:complete